MFITARLIGAAASALTVPAALASVALAYRGVARATALGIAYAIYSGALAVMPILLTFIPGAQWPGFVVAPIAALIALFVVRGRIPDLERPGRLERPYVLGTALWASARRGDLGWRPVAGHRLGAPPSLGDHRLRRRAAGRVSGRGSAGVGSPTRRTCRSTGGR